jgi:hypothetical protein
VNQLTKSKIPANPYRRSPIKKLADLAGRAQETKTIRYYLNLTAASQNPHLALIGQRGVGKTSLLNGAESIATELKLLTIRLDMNELKASSQGRFWHDLYQALVLSMAKAGCWGGVGGPIYAELFRMLHTHQPGCLDKAVLQVPFVFSCHQGPIDSVEIPDALVVHDLNTCRSELQSREFKGIAILIDEADCLGKNVPLLQMFRNIFQIVDNCSLILAGTEAVFPALSEVFSPIPRQFHRVDVKPFAEWIETMQLVLNPIPRDLVETIAPPMEAIRELHEVCGGAPDEVQLYCHHMYKVFEESAPGKMALSPRVYREVLREYRSNSSAQAETVLNAIEALPDILLFESAWVSRRQLTADQNIRVAILRNELRRKSPFSFDERANLAARINVGYETLFKNGITENKNRVHLIGAPLTSGFWSSFVNVERGKRWSWDDDSYAETLYDPIMRTVERMDGVEVYLGNVKGRDAVAALGALRAGDTPAEFEEGMREMIVATLIAQDEKATHIVDITVQIESPAGKLTLQSRFLEKPHFELAQSAIQSEFDEIRELLAGNDITISLIGFERWALPTLAELHRLGRIAGYAIPEILGEGPSSQAIDKFAEGDVQASIDIFNSLLADKESASTRNNLAFCQIVVGEFRAAFENATKAEGSHYSPLYALNKCIAEFMLGRVESARDSLNAVWQRLSDTLSNRDVGASYVLVLESRCDKVVAIADMPVDAAIAINLWRMGAMTRGGLEQALVGLYPKECGSWLTQFPDDKMVS